MTNYDRPAVWCFAHLSLIETVAYHSAKKKQLNYGINVSKFNRKQLQL